MNVLSDFASRHPRQGAQFKQEWLPFLRALLDADKDPIPSAALREGYYLGQNTDYWVSGAIDALKLFDALTLGQMVPPANTRVLELGCSSGRVLRHLSRLIPAGGEVWGTDLNQQTIAWLRSHSSQPITLLATDTAPRLPIDEQYFDVVAAFSVLTHIDRDEERWLLELRRIVKPGGLLYITTLGSSVWREIGPGHVLFQNLGKHPEFASQAFGSEMPEPRLAFAYDERNPYSATVFRTREYIEANWVRHFSSFEFREQYHDFQDVCLFRR